MDLRSYRLVKGYDQRGCRNVSAAGITVDRVGVEVGRVARFNVVRYFSVLNVHLAGKKIQKLGTDMLVRTRLLVAFDR